MWPNFDTLTYSRFMLSYCQYQRSYWNLLKNQFDSNIIIFFLYIYRIVYPNSDTLPYLYHSRFMPLKKKQFQNSSFSTALKNYFSLQKILYFINDEYRVSEVRAHFPTINIKDLIIFKLLILNCVYIQ